MEGRCLEWEDDLERFLRACRTGGHTDATSRVALAQTGNLGVNKCVTHGPPQARLWVVPKKLQKWPGAWSLNCVLE